MKGVRRYLSFGFPHRDGRRPGGFSRDPSDFPETESFVLAEDVRPGRNHPAGRDARFPPRELITVAVLGRTMFGRRSMPAAPSPPPTNDPNEMLRRIDQQTTLMFHWLRAGIIVVIILLIAIALGF